MIGAFPGSFNPPTVAHLAIAEAVVQRLELDRVDLILSERALGKEGVERPLFRDRVAVLRAVAATRPWLGIEVTSAQLIVEIAQGYDVLVLGADKWAQVIDASWYRSPAARDDAVAALPRLAIVSRSPYPVPDHAIRIDVAEAVNVSSTGVREGRHWEWMAPEAAEFAARTGAWIDQPRYESWLAAGGSDNETAKRTDGESPDHEPTS